MFKRIKKSDNQDYTNIHIWQYRASKDSTKLAKTCEELNRLIAKKVVILAKILKIFQG